jgi:hypothetical protein
MDNIIICIITSHSFTMLVIPYVRNSLVTRKTNDGYYKKAIRTRLGYEFPFNNIS